MANPFASLFARLVGDGVSKAVRFSIAQALVETANGASADFATSMAEFGKAYPIILRKHRKDFLSANTLSVIKAQRAIVSAYEAATATSPKSYRQGQGRLSGGILLDALKSSKMYEVDADRVGFLDENYLDRQAAHWYRLNFGAGTGESSNVQEPVKWFGQESGMNFGWTQRRASKSFKLPAGYFIDGAFFPGNTEGLQGRDGSATWTRGRTSRQIKGRHFLEPGIKVLAQELPKGIEEIIELVTKEAIQAGGDYWTGKRVGRRRKIKIKTLRNITGL